MRSIAPFALTVTLVGGPPAGSRLQAQEERTSTATDCPPGYTGSTWEYTGIPQEAEPIDGGQYDGGIPLATKLCVKTTSTQVAPPTDPYPSGVESDGRANTETLDTPNDPLCGSGGCDVTPYPPTGSAHAAAPLHRSRAIPGRRRSPAVCRGRAGTSRTAPTKAGRRPPNRPETPSRTPSTAGTPARRPTWASTRRQTHRTGASPYNERPGPVFGNNVDVFRMAPPGFDTTLHDTQNTVGGDYWRFARGVNADGNWWIGSGDVRRLALFAPGKRIEEIANGALISPSCTLNADYISFRIGGTRSSSQRVELQVQDLGGFPQPGDYQGISGPAFSVYGQDVDRPYHYVGTRFFEQSSAGLGDRPRELAARLDPPGPGRVHGRAGRVGRARVPAA